jgi:hypothetical protein
LTEWTKAFNLNMLNRSCPELGKVLRFVFVGSWYFRVCKHNPETRVTQAITRHCWEVVQLAGLQILNLAILVRVQASQP